MFAALRAALKQSLEGTTQWKKMQHCLMTRLSDEVELRCFLMASRLHSLGFRSIAMYWEKGCWRIEHSDHEEKPWWEPF
jgi:hypothetical protein